MFTNHRKHERMSVPKYYTKGSFHLVDGDRKYHYIRANDVSVTGVGLDLPSSVECGSRVMISFTSQEWRADFEGTVKWCERSDRIGVSKQAYQNYRVGILLDPENAEDNAMLYMNLRDGFDHNRSAKQLA